MTEQTEQQQAAEQAARRRVEADRVASDLAGDIGVQAFDDLCNPDSSRLIMVGGSEWSCEDSELTNRDPESFPIVLVRGGQRYAVEVEVMVTPLGTLVDDQQPTYRTDRGRIQAVNLHGDAHAGRRIRDALLTPSGMLCAACDGRLMAQWVRFPDPSREAEVHADCEHFFRLRREQPEAFRDLGFTLVDQDGLPELLETGSQVEQVAERFGLARTGSTSGEPVRWAHRALPLELFTEHHGKGMRVTLLRGGIVVADLAPDAVGAPVRGVELAVGLTEAWSQHIRVNGGPAGTAADPAEPTPVPVVES